MKVSGIYGVRCLTTGKYCVGGSVAIKRRWATHKRELNRGTHTGIKLLRAWRKYGPDNWEWSILEECPPDTLTIREQYWIDRLDAYRGGYNSLPYAKQGTRGRACDPATIAKIVATRRARNNYGHSEETKKLIGDLQRGKLKGPMSEAQKQLLSKIRKEQGMPESERQRISKMAKERVYTDKIRENIAKAHRGKKHSEETKLKMSATALGKPKPFESMAKTLRIRQERGACFSPATCEKYGLPLILPQCAICGNSFTPKTSGAKTCGPICTKEACRRAAQKRWQMQQVENVALLLINS